MIAVVAKTLPRNADVAEQLELLADLLEIEGEAAFRVLAYRRGGVGGGGGGRSGGKGTPPPPGMAAPLGGVGAAGQVAYSQSSRTSSPKQMRQAMITPTPTVQYVFAPAA
jgi:hypothetical protein